MKDWKLLAAISVAAIILIAFCRKQPPKASQNTMESESATALTAIETDPPKYPNQVPPRKNPFSVFLQTPIRFYGTVRDQDGNPVANAVIDANAMSNLKSGSKIESQSDEMGNFTLKGRGLSLRVEVNKQGYYQTGREEVNPSSQGFDYGTDLGRGIHRPDPANPVVFSLRKHGNPVELQRLSANPNLPRSGTLRVIQLAEGGSALLTIGCKSMESQSTADRRYDWRCVLSVEGGGIREVVGDWNFEAPNDGYLAEAEINMPSSLGPDKWKSSASRDYWLRFPDRTFAKINVRMIAGGDHFAVIKGYRNTDPNNRNLEPKL